MPFQISLNNPFKHLVLAALCLTSIGCSSVKTKELVESDASHMKKKTLVCSRYEELPDFPAQTAVNVQFGLIGVATAISNGNSMIKKNEIEDPARSISQELAKGLSENHNVMIVESDKKLVDAGDIKDVLSAYSDHDYILDVRTTGWGSIYYVSDFNNYKVMYSAHARLINSKSGEVIAEEVCSVSPIYEETNDAPGYEDLEKGHGLKKELTRAVDMCVTHIREKAKLHHANKTDNMASNQ